MHEHQATKALSLAFLTLLRLLEGTTTVEIVLDHLQSFSVPGQRLSRDQLLLDAGFLP